MRRISIRFAVVGTIVFASRLALADAPAKLQATQPAVLKPLLGRADDHTTLDLARPNPTPVDGIPPPLLIRELQRQALLMAARDGLGLYTRDEVLREFDSTVPGGPAALKVSFEYDPVAGRFRSLTSSARAAAAGPAAEQSIPQPAHANLPDVAQAAIWAEESSRAYWPDVLRQAGFTGSVPAENGGPAPSGVDALLYQTSLLAPLAAVQRTHAAVREEGASPARLSALTRGYANLGLLTRFQWSTDHEVFAARSLLYAQRMVVRWPASSLSYWSKAYAQTLAGMHAAAAYSVAKARELQPAGTPLPPWAELIEPLCNYDLATLTDAIAADRQRAPLAAVSAFLTVEQCGSWALVLEVGDATLPYNPACFQTLNVMTESAGVGPGARLTSQAPAALARALPDDAGHLSDLPPRVVRALAAVRAAAAGPDTDDDDRDGITAADVATAAAARSLVDAAAVRSEPSLVVAGRLVQETTFVHVARRAEFITERWGWDGGDYVAAVRPLIADHPLRRYIEAFALAAGDRPAAVRTLVVNDALRTMWQLNALVEREKPVPAEVTGSRVGRRAWQDAAAVAYDLTDMLMPLNAERRKSQLSLSDALRKVSRHAPMIEAARVRDHWELPEVRAECKDWATKFAQQAATLRALAHRFQEDGDLVQAAAAYEQYAKTAGDYREAAELADLYLADGDKARWLATLEAVIKRPDYGLDHAQARVAIARQFMVRGDYKRALPYADEAEQTQAFWAMKCDADCHRGLGDTAGADRIMKAAHDHYGHD